MAEIDPASALVRIDALKQQIQARIENLRNPAKIAAAKLKIETITKLSKELAALEGDVASAEEADRKEAEEAILGVKPKLKLDDIDTSKKGETDAMVAEEERKSRILTEDKEYQSILAMKTGQDVVNYLAANYGVKESPKQAIEKLRFIALEKRKERVFEV